MSTPDLRARSCGSIGDAAVDGDAGQVRVIGEALDVVLDLDGQLAGRREDQDAA